MAVTRGLERSVETGEWRKETREVENEEGETRAKQICRTVLRV